MFRVEKQKWKFKKNILVSSGFTCVTSVCSSSPSKIFSVEEKKKANMSVMSSVVVLPFESRSRQLDH